jgi:hypothetical protein
MATTKLTVLVAAATLLLVGAVSCQKSSAKKAGAAASGVKVESIVFIDKKNACDCTRKRADDSFASLERALGGAKIPVERIYIDTEKERAAPYLDMQAVMVIPGIYLLDGKGGLVAMLQGEQSADKLSAALGK